MSSDVLILLILTFSVVMETTATKVISKGLGALESLWKLGWGGYKNFPHSFPHLNGVHVNHHSWHESPGPVPLGLPVEGILERKDHPYYQLVKFLTKSRPPIATHLGDASRLFKGFSDRKPILHTFNQDRFYAQKEEAKLDSSPPLIPSLQSFDYSPSLAFIDANSLSNYVVHPEANYMMQPNQQHQSDISMSDPGHVFLPFASSPSISSPRTGASLSMIFMPPLNSPASAGDMVSEEQYPTSLSPDALHPFSADAEQEMDPVQPMLTINPLPVYTPISSSHHRLSPTRNLVPYDHHVDEVYEDDVQSDIDSSSSISPKSTLSDLPPDTPSSSAAPPVSLDASSSVVRETSSESRISTTTSVPASDDLVADEDRQERN